MKMFLDSAKTDEIKRALEMWDIDGVTTNPTHVSKTGRPPIELYEEICSLVDGPVSLETVGLDADQIVVLEDGAITERGTHAELLAAGGTYATLAAEQLVAGER